MIFSSVNFKGGTGKSTLAQNLAVSFAKGGAKVCLVDADDTAATLDWSEQRHKREIEPAIVCSLLTNPDSFTSQVRTLYNDGGYDILIIDCPPALSPIAVKAMSISDHLLIPVNTGGGSDIRVTTKLLTEFIKLREIKEDNGGSIQASLIVNNYKSNAILHESGIKQMDKLAEHFGIRRLQTKLHSRVVYGEANSQGYGVVELDNAKAKKEMIQLTKEILALIKS